MPYPTFKRSAAAALVFSLAEAPALVVNINMKYNKGYDLHRAVTRSIGMPAHVKKNLRLRKEINPV